VWDESGEGAGVGDEARFYEVGGIVLEVHSDLPLNDATFKPKFEVFRVDGPGDDNVSIHQHFGLPDVSGVRMAEPAYRADPVFVYSTPPGWTYVEIARQGHRRGVGQVIVFDADFRTCHVYNDDTRRERWLKGGLHSLTMLSSDQILLASLLASRSGCIFHSAGVDLGGEGVLLVGHSGAGKSTAATLLKEALGGDARVLCDDRNIVRFDRDGKPVLYGTWSHGSVSDVSSAPVPLRAVLILHKSAEERVEPASVAQALPVLLECVIKPHESADWWNGTLSVLERLTSATPCRGLYFARRGKLAEMAAGAVAAAAKRYNDG